MKSETNESLNLTLQEMISAGKARPINVPTAPPNPTSFIYDSRKVNKDCLFLCISGNKVDGHDFINDAVTQGAAYVIGDSPEKIAVAAEKHKSTCFLLVESSLAALTRIAAFYRKKFSLPCIGVAGSSGKTTTKDLIGSILSAHGPAVVTEGSFNNQWGLPQTVMRLRPSHLSAVFEIGTNHFGEVEALSEICRPEIGIITTIGKEHLEFLVDEPGVLRANSEMFAWIRQFAGSPQYLFNLDNPFIHTLWESYRQGVRGKILTYTCRPGIVADVRLTQSKTLGFERRFGWEFQIDTPWGRIDGIVPLPGSHNLENAVAAATAALATGTISESEVMQGLAAPKVSHLRSELFKHATGAIVYNDAYNANPTSFSALFSAGQTLRRQAPFYEVIAVVGDMLELGENAATFHYEMGREAARQGVDQLLSIGEFSKEWVEGFESATTKKAVSYPDHKSLIQAVKTHLGTENNSKSKTLILVKGSRGAKMETVVDNLRG
jgi:UDP-N-acetylmuramoyl-tripeptide--D-alanyl-D-alanine ligase